MTHTLSIHPQQSLCVRLFDLPNLKKKKLICTQLHSGSCPFHDMWEQVNAMLSIPPYLTLLHVELWYLSMLGEHPPLKLHPPSGGGHVSRQHLSQLVLQETRSVHCHVVVTIGNLWEREGERGRGGGEGGRGGGGEGKGREGEEGERRRGHWANNWSVHKESIGTWTINKSHLIERRLYVMQSHPLCRIQSRPNPGLCIAICELTNKAWTNRRWKQEEGEERQERRKGP